MARDRRRALGCFYTPPRLVSHVVGAVIGPLMRGVCRAASSGHLEEAFRVRILDLAMGDGLFLQVCADLMARRLARASGRSYEQLYREVARRCLFGIDIDPRAVDLARARLGAAPRLVAGDALGRRFPFDVGPSGFSAVVGNPPWGGWNRRLDAAAKREYRRRFATARGLLDPSVLFIERATGLLASGGRLGLVLPDYLLLKNYPAARLHLLRRYRFEELIHWGRVFPGVNLDAFSLVARRRGDLAGGEPDGVARVRCLPGGPDGPALRIPQARFLDLPGHAINLVLDDAAMALLGRLRSRGVPFGDWLEAHEGIHSGNIRSRIFLPPLVDADEDPAVAASPLVKAGAEVVPFGVFRAGWRVMYDRRLVNRRRGEYANFGRREWFRPPKILVRRTGDRVVAALDRSGSFAGNNLFVARARPGLPVPLEYVEAYLNSSLATWCFRAMQPRVGRLFAELKLVHLNRLPVPPPRGPEHTARILAIAARLRREAAAGAGRGGAGGEAWAALDAAFAQVAGLTPAQARLVEGRFSSTAHSL